MIVKTAESPLAAAAGAARHAPLASAAWAALIVAAGSGALLAGAFLFQYGLNVPPCPLCHEQRIGHYVAAPLGLAMAAAAIKGAPRWLVAAGMSTLVLALLTTAGIGAYHAGVEWRWWPGPADCSGDIQSLGAAGGSLLQQMQKAVVIRCDEVQWRFAGLSLAGFNALVSLSLAAVAGWGLKRTLQRTP
jgi:disulfide bond formation protein DsbB